MGWKPTSGRFFHNLVTGVAFWVSCTKEPKLALALALNVPQLFIVSVDDRSFVTSAPDLEWLSTGEEPACTICGDTPYRGSRLLDRDFDLDSTCQECYPEYLCMLCLCDHKVCLACLQPWEEELLDDKRRRRLAALTHYWDMQDEQALPDGKRVLLPMACVATQGPVP